MTKYIVLNDSDIEQLASEKHIEFRNDVNLKTVICTEEYFEKVLKEQKNG